MRSLPDLKIERPRGTLADKVTEALVRLIDGERAPRGAVGLHRTVPARRDPDHERIATAGRDFWAGEGARYAGDVAVRSGRGPRERAARRTR